MRVESPEFGVYYGIIIIRHSMAERRVGSAVLRFNLVPHLAVFRLVPQRGDSFPPYEAGQYIALRRDHCRLTKRVPVPEGGFAYEPDLDERGEVKRGPVTHSYSVASAPFETEQEGWLEFYVILERNETGRPGRLTESLFQIEPGEDHEIIYYTKIAGDFTLEKRAQGFRNVLMIGTGTGLAPFASMIKQLNHEAVHGRTTNTRFTLIHANRTAPELGYHAALHAIMEAGKLDFVYLPTVSRPSSPDLSDPHLGKGRGNNLLRLIYDLPMREEELMKEAGSDHKTRIVVEADLARAVRPTLPSYVSKADLQKRMEPSSTIIMTCGNPVAMEDVGRIAKQVGAAFSKEEW
jgi:ferredoxin-NADP reductase